jgi:hypothetical protein
MGAEEINHLEEKISETSSKALDSSEDKVNNGAGEQRMTRAKWLACIALAVSYTTSFQQAACLGAIIKSIDEALGEFALQLLFRLTNLGSI